MRIRVILNEHSGASAATHARPSLLELENAFRAAGLDVTLTAAPPAALDHLVAQTAATQPDVLVVGGGDGTLSAAAAHLAGSRTALGILPLGTLNHFARDLGLPAAPADAAAVIAAGHVRRVDVAEVNGRVFLNNCSLGAYPAAVRRRDALRHAHGFGKGRAMAIAAIDVFRRLRRLHATLEIDAARRTTRTALLFVANNRYSGRLFSSALREQLDAGQLWLYATRTHRVFPLLRSVWQAITRGLDAADALDATPASRLTIAIGRPRITAGVDGELVTFDAPLRFRTRPGALRVLTPPP